MCYLACTLSSLLSFFIHAFNGIQTKVCIYLRLYCEPPAPWTEGCRPEPPLSSVYNVRLYVHWVPWLETAPDWRCIVEISCKVRWLRGCRLWIRSIMKWAHTCTCTKKILGNRYITDSIYFHFNYTKCKFLLVLPCIRHILPPCGKIWLLNEA